MTLHDDCELNFANIVLTKPRTTDGGNGNHSVSLPISFVKIKVDQMLPSSYRNSLFVSILHLISYFYKCTALFCG